MSRRELWYVVAVLAVSACGSDTNVQQPVVPSAIEAVQGDRQSGLVGSALPSRLSVKVSDGSGNAAPGVTVSWSVMSGGGTVSPTSSASDANGVASTQFTLGPSEGEEQVQAAVTGLAGSPVVFTETATTTPGPVQTVLSVAAGGNNVPDRYSSDLWVHGNYAYTGTWGSVPRNGNPGNVINVWSLDPSGAPSLVSQVSAGDITNLSDLQVSDDGQLLVASGEYGVNGGIYVYGLSDPAHPTLLGSDTVGIRGVHTVTLATINQHLYAFAALNPGFSGDETEDMPGLLIYDLSQPQSPTLVHREPIPPHYGIHDTYVRDGLAFVFAWDEGVMIFDVGNGMRGGSPAAPVKISQLITAAGNAGTPAAHNGWWFHNPVSGESRYLFVGQEGPGRVGVQSSGDIHVVDVSDLTHPTEVAIFHMNGAGTHNFWMDEQRQVLYAAYYNAGVIALDVSGTLSGNLSNRLLSQIQPGGKGNTYTWGVQLANGSLYAIDMVSGFWQLHTQ